jgi:hypothetical protein
MQRRPRSISRPRQRISRAIPRSISRRRSSARMMYNMDPVESRVPSLRTLSTNVVASPGFRYIRGDLPRELSRPVEKIKSQRAYQEIYRDAEEKEYEISFLVWLIETINVTVFYPQEFTNFKMRLSLSLSDNLNTYPEPRYFQDYVEHNYDGSGMEGYIKLLKGITIDPFNQGRRSLTNPWSVDYWNGNEWLELSIQEYIRRKKIQFDKQNRRNERFHQRVKSRIRSKKRFGWR